MTKKFGPPNARRAQMTEYLSQAGKFSFFFEKKREIKFNFN